jgi:predicted short-subunit dehydrogenase-like oxidoreductase (DUF2520 family)
MQIGIIGMGRLGSALQRNLPGALAVRDFKNREELMKACDTVFLTVPDKVIKEVAIELARGNITGKTVFHCSGALDLEPLASLTAGGAHSGSLHPLQSFGSETVTFSGVYMALEGDCIATAKGRDIASLLGAKIFTVPVSERKLYHAAACFASNYVVTVMSIAEALMSRWTGDKKAALTALLPLLDGTIHNLHQASEAAMVLTGPIARGDSNTIASHLKVLPEQYKEAYKALGKITVALAEQNKSINGKQAAALRKLL